MPWFWPFRKNTEPSVRNKATPEAEPKLLVSSATTADPEVLPVSSPAVEPGALPVALPGALPVALPGALPVAEPVASPLPDSLKRSCAFVACGVPSASCLPVALSFCLPCRPFFPQKAKNSDLLATPPLEIRSVDSASVTASVTASLTKSEAPVSDVTPVTAFPSQASSLDVPRSLPQPPAEI